ncbi:hypothetical protein K502DRAFT_324469 [Neoconidiobolus thromboides FSU 785]|nr:hypothetical protein K502DRAFT_324469 [Neoconidiobolus thromboides FSU 785]
MGLNRIYNNSNVVSYSNTVNKKGDQNLIQKKQEEGFSVDELFFATDVKYSFNCKLNYIPLKFNSFEEYKKYHIALIKDSLQCNLMSTINFAAQKRITYIEKEVSNANYSNSFYKEFDEKEIRILAMDSNFDLFDDEDLKNQTNEVGIIPNGKLFCNLQLNFKKKKDFSDFMKGNNNNIIMRV